MSKSNSILIIGAGIAGLASGALLARAGFDVSIADRTKGDIMEGAGVQLSPNATRVLQKVGVLDQLIKCSVRSQDKIVRVWNTGKRFSLAAGVPIASGDYPYLTVMRSDLWAVLKEAVLSEKPNAIRFNKNLVAISQESSGVAVDFQDGTSERADIVIAADGIRSSVRALLWPGTPVEFSGLVAWRALLDAKNVAKSIRRPIATCWIGPNAHVVHYPVASGQFINLVAVVPGQWISSSWSEQADPSALRSFFKNWHPEVQSLMRASVRTSRWALMSNSAPEVWWKGRVLLIGDACHAMLPFMAQGACTALEDACILARLIGADGNPSSAFEQFQKARQARVTRLAEESKSNIVRFHSTRLGSPTGVRRHMEEHWSPTAIERRYRWVYSYDARSSLMSGCVT